jgi:hypothetical protein
MPVLAFQPLKNTVSGYVVFLGDACKLVDECGNVYSKRIGRRWAKTAALTGTLLPALAAVAIRSEGCRPVT